MGLFKDKYIHRCKELKIEPSQLILGQCLDKYDKDVPVLALHGVSLTDKMCMAIAHGLSEDVIFKKLILADCFLGDDGCIAIAGALRTNKTLQYVDLRGNNIRGDGAIALGQALRMNVILKHLSLEWNCIGIWSNGMNSISDALSVNTSLKSLDLRNNRIGPQNIQYLSIALKHNLSLERLDLRWNNAGTSGGKALLELLTWQSHLIEVQVAGNEIPDDICVAIATAVSKNKESSMSLRQSQMMSQEISATVESITRSHQVTLSGYKERLDSVFEEKTSLNEKLSLASLEISSCHDIQRMLEKRVDDLEKENVDLIRRLDKLKLESDQKLADVQRALVIEREKRIQVDEEHTRVVESLLKDKSQVETQLHDIELKSQILKKDKTLLIEQVDQIKDREIEVIHIWESKLKHLEETYQEKIVLLNSSHDSQLADKLHKQEQKYRTLEAEKEKIELILDTEKSKIGDRKRQWEQKYNDLEESNRMSMNNLRKQNEDQIASLQKQCEQFQAQLASLSRQHTQSLIEHEETILKQAATQKANIMHELSSLQIKLKTLTADNEELNAIIQRFRDKEALHNNNLTQIQKETKIQQHEQVSLIEGYRKRISELEETIQHKEERIRNLVSEITRLRDELDDKDEDYLLKMKELQLSINQLMEKRTRRGGVPSESIEKSLAV